MKLGKKNLLALFLVASLLISCGTVPLTERQQVLIIPAAKMRALSFQGYESLKREKSVITGTTEAQMVQRVGQRLQRAVERYFRDKGQGELLAEYRWEFTLFNNKEPNAFCMDGGKVGIYSGILPVTKNEDGLAAVMGHEIAHAVASHGRERASQQMVARMGSSFLQSSLNSMSPSPMLAQSLMTAYGLGSKFGVLMPFSRLHESEADRLGIIFMAMAGYDPHEAPKIWQRMQTHFGGGPPEFLSTHPSNQSRIDELTRLIPEAMRYRRAR